MKPTDQQLVDWVGEFFEDPGRSVSRIEVSARLKGADALLMPSIRADVEFAMGTLYVLLVICLALVDRRPSMLPAGKNG